MHQLNNQQNLLKATAQSRSPLTTKNSGKEYLAPQTMVEGMKAGGSSSQHMAETTTKATRNWAQTHQVHPSTT